MKKILVTSFAVLSAITPAFVAISCNKPGQQTEFVKTASYSDSMQKLASKDITLAGGWGDCRFFANKEADNLIAVGATDAITNDGIQVSKNVKQGDIDALVKLFQTAIQASYEKNNSSLQINFGTETNPKIQSVFQIYSHNSYTALQPTNKLTYDIKGDYKNAYGSTPEAGSDYFTIDSNGSVKVKGNQKINIQFIPSSDPKLVQLATAQLKSYFESIGINNINFTVATNYNAAAAALEANSIQVAFLPVDSWAKNAQSTNFILQAGRPVQIIDPYKAINDTTEPAITDEKTIVEAFDNYKTFNASNGKSALYINSNIADDPQSTTTGYPEALKNAVDSIATAAKGKALPAVGYYRSYIYARKDSEIAKLILNALNTQGSDWKLNWNDVKKYIKYGFTSTTSSASYNYPEAWFKKHFTGFKSFVNS